MYFLYKNNKGKTYSKYQEKHKIYLDAFHKGKIFVNCEVLHIPL